MTDELVPWHRQSGPGSGRLPPRDPELVAAYTCIDALPVRYVRNVNFATAHALRIPAKSLNDKGRRRDIALYRHAGMWIAWHLSDRSTSWIGRWFARDHSTVVYAIRRIEWMIDGSAEVQDVVRKIVVAYLALPGVLPALPAPVADPDANVIGGAP